MAEPGFEGRQPGSKAHTVNHCTDGDILLPRDVKSFKEEVLFGLCSKDKQKLARQREAWRKFISQGTGQ